MICRVTGVAAVLLATALCFAGAARAEAAWVKDELVLNLRSGAGTQYRIKGSVKTGDALEIVERRPGWTHVRGPAVGDGWIPEGYLQPEPPAGMRLERSEAQTAEFRAQFDGLSSRVQELETTNTELRTADESQRSEIESLTRENLELKAGARWPEWITGAGILSAGMVMGAILHSVSGRRQRPRIRL